MAEENGAVRSRPKRKRAAKSTDAAAERGESAASPAAGPPKLVDTIMFEFTADRFGFDPTPRRMGDEIGYAREALRALEHWKDVIRELLGDVDHGLRIAGDARILPDNPTWSSTLESRERVHDNLGVELEDRIAAEIGSPAQGGVLIDQKTRDAVEELRIYLRMLWTWRRTLEAGLWIATIAARGSVEDDPHRRLLQGLGAIAAVCEFVAIDTPDRILAELRGLAAHASGLTAESTLPATIVSAANGANAAFERQSSESPVEFVDEPARLYDWAEGLRLGFVFLENASGSLTVDEWVNIERLYWGQWDWQLAGPVVRREDSMKMTVFDLVMAARYDGATFLHWRGGLLSSAQWSRILAIVTPNRLDAMREPAEAALGQLGFSELIGRKLPDQPRFGAVGGRNSARVAPPLVALSLAPRQSAVLLWRPEPAVRVFALLPRERYEADERIAHYGSEVPSLDSSLLSQVVQYREPEGKAARLHLIEVGPARDFGDVQDDLSEVARGIYWTRVYFGGQQPAVGGARRSLRSSARSIRELVREVRQEFPELFPDEPMSYWRRQFMRLYRRFQLSAHYAVVGRGPFLRWLKGRSEPSQRKP
jgi:hypothetical protein